MASADAPRHTDLREYAPIGDGRTIALVGRRGQIDWLPLPHLDSLPVFAGLLDTETGGRIELEPDEEYTVRRRYLPRTNVLETTFRTASGSARVTDAMVTGVAGRLPWAELARRIEGVEGSVRFRWRVQPGTRLQTAAPWIEERGGVSILRVGDISLAVVGDGHGTAHAQPDGDDGPAVHGSFATRSGSSSVLILVATDGEPLHLPDPGNVQRGIDRTVAGWRAWSREFSYDGPWQRAVQRSALALKLLVYAPTGAIAAAATTSLPESPRGGKNWDYRFAWVRDLAYTTHALVRFGLREETHAAISWLLQTIRQNGPELHVFYSLRGEVTDGVHEYDVGGWRGLGPVVTGNPAHGQLQLGVYGDLFAICRTYVDGGNILDVATGRSLAAMADRTCDLWRQPDSGMWELPELRHYTSSKMGCWQALNDAVFLAERDAIPGNPERWRSERDRIAEWVAQHGWSEEAGSYVMHPGTTDLDTSVLLHAESGFDRGERMAATIDAITRDLGAGPLLYRYTGMDQEEHTFVAAAFWRVSALACIGRHREAVEAMDDLVSRANDVGIFAEMIAEDDGAFWGNVPQALSHLGVVSAALTIRDLVPAELLDGR
ncbi:MULTISPECIES: glycoside hydrolase family 15 protein [Microbacterium]|uniref:Glycoside hydrolase family 15 protein n=1 Tax=Microbacterium wangchenii TaxID=2541726 RepID=A0ABX5SWZ6_9MICO|nr:MULTISPECIES: glycoside hydrolase family 15 protein [Microbacterium]MCK6067286.1 glycoside hydrolase family 15 protein [Microbacterium sp. EYE_512]QBR89770.1 glycoside hydrolase family 15 protein [Microbacterium wangchenii]TXK16632.1 glycoside hydrolase family 15 protein [Microbacterium wangchenii]